LYFRKRLPRFKLRTVQKQGNSAMKIYQFEMWGKKFSVDVESGNFFEVDKLSAEAITLLQRHSAKETAQILNKRFKSESVKKTLRNMSRLNREGLLFSDGQRAERNVTRRITDLTLNIVNKCNLRCRYCWNKGGSYGNSSKDSSMGFSIALKAVELLLKESKGVKDLVVDFYGGEPLLNFALIKKLVIYCKGIQESRKVKFRFLLATNGTLLNKTRGEFLIGNGADVAVSLDGTQRIQDRQRPFPDEKGSFDTVISNIHSIREDFRKRIVGRATFTPFSTEPVATFKFLKNLGFERIEVCESEQAGYGLESDNQFFFAGSKGIRSLKRIYRNLAVFYTREIIKGNLTYENTYFNRFFKQLSRLYHLQSVIGTCSAGFSLMAVDMDGSIYPCTAFVGIPRFKIGDVSCGINEERLKAFSEIKISSSTYCSRCWAKRICRGCGSCYNLNYFTNEDLSKPNPYYCELFRYKTKLMIAMIAAIGEKSSRLLEKVLIPEYYSGRGRRVGK